MEFRKLLNQLILLSIKLRKFSSLLMCATIAICLVEDVMGQGDAINHHSHNSRIDLPATESIKRLNEGSDFLLDYEIRHLINLNDDIHIHFIRLSETIKPSYKEIYPYQNSSNDEYKMDTNVRYYHSKFENTTIYNYEVENLALLLDQLNVTYASKDFSNVFYKVKYNMYNITQNSLINERFINVIEQYKQEKALYVNITKQTLGNVKKIFRDKIHSTLLSDFLQNQRNIAFYITDFQDDEINKQIEEIFSDVQAPYFDSQSILFLHKPQKINYNSFLKTIANSSEVICFQSIYASSDCKETEGTIASLPKTIYQLIPARSGMKFSIVNIENGVLKSNESIDPLPLEFEYLVKPSLTHLTEFLLREYIETILSNYIRYQSDFLELFTKYSFRSPLNFLMVKHDFQIFIHEFLRCESKLKYGYYFIQQSLLINYSNGAMHDNRKSKNDIGATFLKEKDNCKARLIKILEEYSHLVHADNYQCNNNTNIMNCLPTYGMKNCMCFMKKYFIPITLGVILMLFTFYIGWRAAYSKDAYLYIQKKKI